MDQTHTNSVELADCDYCHKQYDYAKRFWRWDFKTCSMKCLRKISTFRINKEAREEEEREQKNNHHASYTSGGGSAY